MFSFLLLDAILSNQVGNSVTAVNICIAKCGQTQQQIHLVYQQCFHANTSVHVSTIGKQVNIINGIIDGNGSTFTTGLIFKNQLVYLILTKLGRHFLQKINSCDNQFSQLRTTLFLSLIQLIFLLLIQVFSFT